jgi:uncharacterized protein (TIGR03032 family)
LRSVHTSNFPGILQELGISLVVSTYQAGKLVLVRPEGDSLNTHFRGFHKPMGLAASGDRLAIGTALEIWEYHNTPAVARRLPPAGVHDACFLPRSSVCTGDIQIHEMAWAEEELWFINTRFSCLCTRSNQHRVCVAEPVRKPSFGAPSSKRRDVNASVRESSKFDEPWCPGGQPPGGADAARAGATRATRFDWLQQRRNQRRERSVTVRPVL